MKEETREEKVLNEATICFLVKGDRILLGMKTDKIGKGCWNGYGGGPKEGETLEQCVIRELGEETCGVVTTPQHLEKIAIVDFHNTKRDGSKFVCKVHVYLVHEWEGEARETKEMITPTWFSKDKLPFDTMMPADRDWLPDALSGKKIYVKAYLGPYQQKKTDPTEIEYVDSF